MYENLLNTFLFNRMPGASISHSICDCGYESKDNSFSYLGFCPNCNTLISAADDHLSFDKIKFYNRKIFIDALDKKSPYRFYIAFIKKEGDYKISFSKKQINKIQSKINKVYVVEFDSFRTKEGIIRYIDVNNQKIISQKEFEQSIDNYNSYNLYKGSNYSSTINSYYPASYFSELGTSIKNFITRLNKLADWCSNPYNEILIKIGIDPYRLPDGAINKEGKNPSEVLSLKKYTIKLLKDNLTTYDIYNTLKNLETSLSSKIVPYVEKFVKENSELWLTGNIASKAINLINDANLSVEKLYKYLYKDAILQQGLYNPSNTIELLSDSFMMTKQLGLIFDKSPKALVRYHNTLAKEISTIKNRDKDNLIKNVSQKYSNLEEICTTKNENDEFIEKYSIIIPKCSEDIILEGKMMRHCVGSYVDKMAKEQCVILFLRSSQFLHKSYVTIEYNPISKSIVQIKGFTNSKVSQDVLNYIRKWAKKHKINVSSYY